MIRYRNKIILGLCALIGIVFFFDYFNRPSKNKTRKLLTNAYLMPKDFGIDHMEKLDVLDARGVGVVVSLVKDAKFVTFGMGGGMSIRELANRYLIRRAGLAMLSPPRLALQAEAILALRTSEYTPPDFDRWPDLEKNWSDWFSRHKSSLKPHRILQTNGPTIF